MLFPFEIPENREFDCVGFGVNAVDHLIVVPEFPHYDTKSELVESIQAAGGQNASAMVGLQRLGMKTAYVGRFGSDEEGHFGIESLIEEGIDVTRSELVEGARTQIGYIIIDARMGERTVIWKRDKRLAYSAADAVVEMAGKGRVLHLDAHDPAACLAMATRAREYGTVVSADIDNVYEGLHELLPMIDLLICAKELPHQLTDIDNVHQALVEVNRRYGCRLVGITLGQRGAICYTNNEFVDTEAYDVPGGCRDTTGAGDAFHAGFLYGMLSGGSVKDSMELGSATAALKCRRLGARSGLPTREELMEFICQNNTQNTIGAQK